MLQKNKLKYIELRNNDYYDNEIYNETITDTSLENKILSFIYPPEIVYNYGDKIIIYCETNVITTMNINYKELVGGNYIPIYNNKLSKIHKIK